MWSLPVTWQRWRSHHSIRNIRKPHAICKLHDSISYRTRVVADWIFTLREKGISRFLRKIVEIIKIFRSHLKKDVIIAETHFLTHYRLFYVICYRTYTHSKFCFTPNRWVCGYGHFRSRDKDGGHTIRSAMADNPLLYANFTTLSFIEQELLPIEILRCGNREFCVLLRKIVEIIKKILFAPQKGRSCHRNTSFEP